MEIEETKLVTKIESIDITQQKIQESVTGFVHEKTVCNKRLLEIKQEHAYLKTKLDESNLKSLDLGITVDEIKTDQQEIKKNIDILQHMATESDISGKETFAFYKLKHYFIVMFL